MKGNYIHDSLRLFFKNLLTMRIFVLDSRTGVIYYKSMETPISKTQKRAMDLLGLTPVSTYDAAAAALENVNGKQHYTRDGIPAGMTWRQAAKLSDTELLKGLGWTWEQRFPEQVEY